MYKLVSTICIADVATMVAWSLKKKEVENTCIYQFHWNHVQNSYLEILNLMKGKGCRKSPEREKVETHFQNSFKVYETKYKTPPQWIVEGGEEGRPKGCRPSFLQEVHQEAGFLYGDDDDGEDDDADDVMMFM